MALPGDTSLPVTDSPRLTLTDDGRSIAQHFTSASELVFTQDALGTYLSFYWENAAAYQIELSALVGQRMSDVGDRFSPVAIASYLNWVQQTLDRLTPFTLIYPFRTADQYLLFELVLSPVLQPSQPATAVIVTGQVQRSCTKTEALSWVDQLNEFSARRSSDSHSRYHKLLSQIAWNIRRTLDLGTIWQQTVDGLGRSLELDRCLICPYKPDAVDLEPVAEFCQPHLDSLLSKPLHLADHPHLLQAIETRRPIPMPPMGQSSMALLVVPTCYQDQPNSLILMYQGGPSSTLNRLDLDPIRELADQVGTGIAHARLLADSRNLTLDLQHANENLMKQHQELEEARQQAVEASKLKSEFLAKTTHELRTPLNGIINFLKFVMEGMADDPEEEEDYISGAYDSAILLLNIINDILDLAKIEANKTADVFKSDPIRLDDLLTEVERKMRLQVEQKNLCFEIRTPATRDDIVLKGDHRWLLQIMHNLVGNAVKFTDEGSITITAELSSKTLDEQTDENTPGLVTLSVADTGIGVSLEDQDKLFQSFSQVDGSRTRQYGGTGLGLSIAQKAVEAMGGVMKFYSMGEGLGSTVTFTVPLYQVPVIIIDQPKDDDDL
ncbi:MAG: GAF domain-containing protein [Kaiparowitsia implicata GSE-PSE-MK54-09C]|jgi:signal transduction histidine kinase|nr:GAF domain-containing protein [Kaiparowitsia implicata GSE-PSE-MK54-09C]